MKLNIKSLFLTLTIIISSFFMKTSSVLASSDPNCISIFNESKETEKLFRAYWPFVTYGLIIAFFVYSSMDAVKTLSSSDQKDNKNFYKKMGKRMIIVVMALLVPTLLKWFLEALGLKYCFWQ